MTILTQFLAVPNTGENIRKQYEWLTDVQPSRNGTEGERSKLRAEPRVVFNASYYIDQFDMHELRAGDVFELLDHPILPNGQYELLEPNVELEHVSFGAMASVSLAWLVVNSSRPLPAADYPLIDGALYFPEQLLNGREGAKESIAASVNEFDAGHLRSRRVRYKKRTLSVLVSLFNEQEIALFESFLMTVAGRHRAFKMRHPVDGVLKTFRLSSDSVELNYYTTQIAECSLRITELDE